MHPLTRVRGGGWSAGAPEDAGDVEGQAPAVADLTRRVADLEARGGPPPGVLVGLLAQTLRGLLLLDDVRLGATVPWHERAAIQRGL